MDEYDLYISQKSLQLKKAMKETPYYLQRKQGKTSFIKLVSPFDRAFRTNAAHT